MVAGTNYKLLLSVADASNQKKNLEVTVYGAWGPRAVVSDCIRPGFSSIV